MADSWKRDIREPRSWLKTLNSPKVLKKYLEKIYRVTDSETPESHSERHHL